jgi:hydrocephalus-inducing protein
MYKCSLSFKLYNISKVDFKYKLHIPGDSSNPEEKEFEITPSTNWIRKIGDSVEIDTCEEIEIVFTPRRLGKYDYVLVVDLVGIGSDMLSIPITAECLKPKVDIVPSEKLDFGEVFLDFEEK